MLRATGPGGGLLPYSGGWRGRPLKDRAELARAFLATAVLDVPTTRALVERRRTEGLLRGRIRQLEEEKPFLGEGRSHEPDRVSSTATPGVWCVSRRCRACPFRPFMRGVID